MKHRLRDINEQWNEDTRTPYRDIAVLGVVQFFVSTLIDCYGVVLMQLILQNFCDLKTGLWTAVLFTAAAKITNPWTKTYCKHLDNTRHKAHRRNLVVSTLLLAAQQILTSVSYIPAAYILFYGLLSGVLSSIIYVHLQFANAEVFQSRARVYGAVDQIIKPFSMVMVPHVLLLLIDHYGAKYSHLILSGILLHIVPACLLIQRRKYRPNKLYKFQTLDRLSIEMVDMNHKPVVVDSSSSSEEDEDDFEIDTCEPRNEANDTCDGLNPSQYNVNVHTYYHNVGVKILPNIPEENEVDDDDDINEISSKRLSRISAALQELNPSKIDNTSVNNLFQPDDGNVQMVQSVEQEAYDEKVEIGALDAEKKHCFSVGSSVLYKLQLKKLRLKSFFDEHFVRSVCRTLSNACFYPALISSSIVTTVPRIVLATIPYLMMEKSEPVPLVREDAAFILTTIGIAGLFFITGYPVYNKCSPFKLKILFLTGLALSGLSLYVVSQDFEYRNIMLFSLMFGLGHAIVSYSENLVYEDFFGKSNWDKLQDALEISTGHVVILIYLIIYLSSVDISTLLFKYACWLYVFNACLWILAFLVKNTVTLVKNVRHYQRTRYPNYNF